MSRVVKGSQILMDGQGVLGEGLLWGWVAAPEVRLHHRLSQYSENHLRCPKSSLASQITPSLPRFPRPAWGHIPNPLTPGFREERKGGRIERGRGGDGKICSALGNLWERT